MQKNDLLLFCELIIYYYYADKFYYFCCVVNDRQLAQEQVEAHSTTDLKQTLEKQKLKQILERPDFVEAVNDCLLDRKTFDLIKTSTSNSTQTSLDDITSLDDSTKADTTPMSLNSPSVDDKGEDIDSSEEDVDSPNIVVSFIDEFKQSLSMRGSLLNSTAIQEINDIQSSYQDLQNYFNIFASVLEEKKQPNRNFLDNLLSNIQMFFYSCIILFKSLWLFKKVSDFIDKYELEEIFPKYYDLTERAFKTSKNFFEECVSFYQQVLVLQKDLSDVKERSIELIAKNNKLKNKK